MTRTVSKRTLKHTIHFTLLVAFAQGCGEELDVVAEVEGATQAHGLSEWDAGRGPTFLELVRLVNLDNKQKPLADSVESSLGNHTCTAVKSAEHASGTSYHVLCARAGRDQDKRGLLFVFLGTQDSDELACQRTSQEQAFLRFPWHATGKVFSWQTLAVNTLVDWATRVKELSPFVEAEINAYRKLSDTAVTNPVIFAGHSKGGVVAQLFGLARATIESSNPFDGPVNRRYTTVISFNAPKPTSAAETAQVYLHAPDDIDRRYKTVWIERRYDAIQSWPFRWPGGSTYQLSSFSTPSVWNGKNHRFVNYTTEEMRNAAHQLELDPWGGKPKTGRFGFDRSKWSCDDQDL